MANEPQTGSTLEDLGPNLAEIVGHVAAGHPVSISDLQTESLAYFDGHPFPDDYFNILAAISLQSAIVGFRGSRLLDYGLLFASRWETANPGHRLHKGSGHYFAGMRDILLGDLPRGFLFMHQAFVEDQQSSGQEDPPTPALAFITLNADKDNQAFYEQVVTYAALLDGRLRRYRKSRRGRLTLADLRQRRALYPSLTEPLFQLAYIVARLAAIERDDLAIARNNPFARGLFGRLASDLCLLIENAASFALPGESRFIRTATAYAPKAKLGLVRADFDDANAAFGDDFVGTLQALLGGKCRTRTGRRVVVGEADLLIAYGIRNQTAHTVSSEKILERRFEQVEARLFSALFRAVESLYP